MTLRLRVLQDLCAALTKVLSVSTSKLFSLFLFTLGSSKSLLLSRPDRAVPDGVGVGGVMTRWQSRGELIQSYLGDPNSHLTGHVGVYLRKSGQVGSHNACPIQGDLFHNLWWSEHFGSAGPPHLLQHSCCCSPESIFELMKLNIWRNVLWGVEQLSGSGVSPSSSRPSSVEVWLPLPCSLLTQFPGIALFLALSALL